MADQSKTDITFVLDRSGSMAVIRTDTEGGFNQLIADQKALKADVRVSLMQFDDVFEEVYSALPVEEVPELRLEPRGFTALHDAIGITIKKTGERLAKLPESERPGKVIFVIMTDGGENASREYLNKIEPLIKHQRETYNWDFVFIGANQDAVLTGNGLGIGINLSMAANSAGTAQAYASTSALLWNKAVAPDAIASIAVSYTEQDQQAQIALGAVQPVGTFLPNVSYVPFGAPNT